MLARLPDVSSGVRVRITSADKNDAYVGRVYRIVATSLAAVQFDSAAKGNIVFLTEGAEIRVVGSSSLSGCVEVMCENCTYNIFKADLAGTRARRIQPIRAVSAMRASA
jgi:hypothetical protein